MGGWPFLRICLHFVVWKLYLFKCSKLLLMAGYYLFYYRQMHIDHHGFCPEVLATTMNIALLLSKLLLWHCCWAHLGLWGHKKMSSVAMCTHISELQKVRARWVNKVVVHGNLPRTVVPGLKSILHGWHKLFSVAKRKNYFKFFNFQPVRCFEIVFSI